MSVLLFSCDYLKKSDKSDNANSTESQTENQTSSESSLPAVPNFDGEWTAEGGTWGITITKVQDVLYDVKFHSTETVDWFKKANGSYNGYGKYISKEVPVDYNSGNAANDIGKEYRINFSDNGKLYFAQTFFTKQKQ